jgi:hypothetical protein
MSAIKNISLYIPHVFPNFDKEYVARAFKKIGEVSQIDFVAKQDRNGQNFNAVYVHFSKWFTNKKVLAFYESVIDESKEARLCHDEPWFWIVLPNTAKKHISGDRKPRIDLGESKSISSSNAAPATPVKSAPTELVCPDAPIKSSCAKSIWAERKKQRKDDILDKVVDPEDENATKIKTITSIILDSEDDLSDGFGYYCGERGIEKTLEGVAKKILATLDEPADEEVDDLQPYSSEEAEMDEIEAELAAEDENLVSVDWRYIKTIEEENMYLHCEVAQLRQALINMEQMYKAEAAKVRAFNATSVDL